MSAIPRCAATCVLLTECAGQAYLLTVRRHSNARFLPNYHVFPGGCLEARDFELPQSASQMISFASPSSYTLSTAAVSPSEPSMISEGPFDLHHPHINELYARARRDAVNQPLNPSEESDPLFPFRVAALRELAEETGIIPNPDGSVRRCRVLPHTRTRSRHEATEYPKESGGTVAVEKHDTLHERSLSSSSSSSSSSESSSPQNATVDLSVVRQLVPIAHWVTPEWSSYRYDTWFFVLFVHSNALAVSLRRDRNEITDVEWVPVTEGLARHRADPNSFLLAEPTLAILEELEKHIESLDKWLDGYRAIRHPMVELPTQ